MTTQTETIELEGEKSTASFTSWALKLALAGWWWSRVLSLCPANYKHLRMYNMYKHLGLNLINIINFYFMENADISHVRASAGIVSAEIWMKCCLWEMLTCSPEARYLLWLSWQDKTSHDKNNLHPFTLHAHTGPRASYHQQANIAMKKKKKSLMKVGQGTYKM